MDTAESSYWTLTLYVLAKLKLATDCSLTDRKPIDLHEQPTEGPHCVGWRAMVRSRFRRD